MTSHPNQPVHNRPTISEPPARARRTSRPTVVVADDGPITENLLFELPRVVGTPHLPASATEAQRRVGAQVADMCSPGSTIGWSRRQSADRVGFGEKRMAGGQPDIHAKREPLIRICSRSRAA